MADLDPGVLDLAQRINQLVVADTGGRSAGLSERALEVVRRYEKPLKLLSDNRDIPARLAGGPRVVLTRASAQIADQRAEVRAAVTAVVAACASSLDPRDPTPTADPDHADRLGSAIGDAYAAAATRGLVPRLLENGRPDDLGLFPPPLLEGDPSAARALGLAIGARLDLRDDQVLVRLVGAGRGEAGPAAARMLLAGRPAFTSLPAGRQQDVFVEKFAERLEAGFAARDLRAAKERELTDEIENRRTDISGGAGAVDTASAKANEELEELHEFLETLPDWRPAPAVEQVGRPGLPTERPASVDELLQRMRSTVGELTGAPDSLGNGQFVHTPIGLDWQEVYVAHDADGTLFLNADRVDAPLRLLTTDGPAVLTEQQADDARAALQSVTATLSWQAVPAGYTRADEIRAQAAVGHEFTQAVGQAFSEDCLDDCIERAFPPFLTAQLTDREVPFVDPGLVPAARGFARTVDDLKGRDTVPSETLRQLAGQDRATLATTAAEVLMHDTGIPAEQRGAVAREVASRVDAAFAMLPAQVDAWRQTGMPDADIAGKSREFGQRLGQEAHAIVRAHQNPASRFVPGRDPASMGVGGTKPVERLAAAPQSSDSAHRATGEQKSSSRDR